MSWPGYRLVVVDRQVRNWRYLGPPLRCPTKAAGRRLTRKQWKRQANRQRGWCVVLGEPLDVIVFGGSAGGGKTMLVTARQLAALETQSYVHVAPAAVAARYLSS